MVDLIEKDFKTTFLKTFKELKEVVEKDLNRQKKESANMKIGHWILSNLRNRKKFEEN